MARHHRQNHDIGNKKRLDNFDAFTKARKERLRNKRQNKHNQGWR